MKIYRKIKKRKEGSKLSKIKKGFNSARQRRTHEKKKDLKNDLLKHFIRVHFWMPRIKNLIRVRGDSKPVSYLSLCAEEALDLRLFRKEKLVDLDGEKLCPFAYCEYDKKSFDVLNEIFKDPPCAGFCGKIENITTDPRGKDYGRFWSKFPFDVINLDFWGDIHKAGDTTENVYYAIYAIISQQSFLRKPYELWITERSKEDRVALTVQNEYRNLIKYNFDNPKFKKFFKRDFPDIHKSNLSVLPFDKLVNIGFLKWLLFVAERTFSVIENTSVLVYKRTDKDGKNYRLYNFLMRIRPWEQVIVPSPACQAADICKEKYENNLKICFKKPINVNDGFKKLEKSERDELKQNLEELVKEYNRDISGYLDEE